MTTQEFSQLVIKSLRSLRPFAVRMTKDSETAQDLMQETAIKALLNKQRFTEGTNIKAWLYTIMRNTFNTAYQKEQKRNSFVDTTENSFYIDSSFANTSRNSAQSDLVLQDINKAMNRLEELYRTPFDMFVRGFKYQEIAEQLRIPIGTVKNRIFVARQKLQETLSHYKQEYAL